MYNVFTIGERKNRHIINKIGNTKISMNNTSTILHFLIQLYFTQWVLCSVLEEEYNKTRSKY